VHDLPIVLRQLSEGVPLTHGIAAARHLATGSSVGSVLGLIGAEALIGVAYAAVGYSLIRGTETLSRRRATLERA
jgi:ABC-2 type transport system permease protein